MAYKDYFKITWDKLCCIQLSSNVISADTAYLIRANAKLTPEVLSNSQLMQTIKADMIEFKRPTGYTPIRGTITENGVTFNTATLKFKRVYDNTHTSIPNENYDTIIFFDSSGLPMGFIQLTNQINPKLGINHMITITVKYVVNTVQIQNENSVEQISSYAAVNDIQYTKSKLRGVTSYAADKYSTFDASPLLGDLFEEKNGIGYSYKLNKTYYIPDGLENPDTCIFKILRSGDQDVVSIVEKVGETFNAYLVSPAATSVGSPLIKDASSKLQFVPTTAAAYLNGVLFSKPGSGSIPGRYAICYYDGKVQHIEEGEACVSFDKLRRLSKVPMFSNQEMKMINSIVADSSQMVPYYINDHMIVYQDNRYSSNPIGVATIKQYGSGGIKYYSADNLIPASTRLNLPFGSDIIEISSNILVARYWNSSDQMILIPVIGKYNKDGNLTGSVSVPEFVQIFNAVRHSAHLMPKSTDIEYNAHNLMLSRGAVYYRDIENNTGKKIFRML